MQHLPRRYLIPPDRGRSKRRFLATLPQFRAVDASDGDRRLLPEFLVNLAGHGIFLQVGQMMIASVAGRLGSTSLAD